MSETNQPKGDRVGNDYSRGPNPNPGGEVDTGDSEVPPYTDRHEGRNERAETPDRALSGEAPPKDTVQPESSAGTEDEGEMAPDGVGQSFGKRGEDATKGQKEPGRQEAGTEGGAERPVGTSDDRDVSGI